MKEKIKLDVLLSCMYQDGRNIIGQSGITGNAVVINQCDREEYDEFFTDDGGKVRFFSTCQRGLTKSRNMAIEKSDADICILCDDDEIFEPDYRKKILTAYRRLPQADVIAFKMSNRPPSFEDKVMRLRFPRTMKISSWQISFRRSSLLTSNVRFDELMGAGSGNGAEEELKFLCDCEKAGLKIYYVPYVIASVAQEESTWFKGFNKEFFYNRGSTTRYIMGVPLAILYGVYYVIAKRKMYEADIAPITAFKAILLGIRDNRLGKISKRKKNNIK